MWGLLAGLLLRAWLQHCIQLPFCVVLSVQEKTLDFYEQFHVIVLGLDSLEARRYMNSVACSFLGEPCFSFRVVAVWLAGVPELVVLHCVPRW